MKVGNEDVNYIEIDLTEAGRTKPHRKVYGTYRVCKRTSAETGENVLEANELPCPEGYVHPSHISK